MKTIYSFQNKIANIAFLLISIILSIIFYYIFSYDSPPNDSSSYFYWLSLFISLYITILLFSFYFHDVTLNKEKRTICLGYLCGKKVLSIEEVNDITLRNYEQRRGRGALRGYVVYIEIHMKNKKVYVYPLIHFKSIQNLNEYSELIKLYIGIIPKIGKIDNRRMFESFRKRESWRVRIQWKGLICP